MTHTPIYIVFLIDLEHNQHDGSTFISLKEAREYVKNMVDGFYYNRAIIGMTALNEVNKVLQTTISQIETYGFKNSKKKVELLSLFQ